MSDVLNRKHQSLFPFIKMNGAGNDFIIFDARKNHISLTAEKIREIADRKSKHMGCDQIIVIQKSAEADCEMEIYNADGSLSGACGNATRCVASILFEEKENAHVESANKAIIKIKTIVGVLETWIKGSLISVNMGKPNFDWQKIPLAYAKDTQKISLQGFDFACVNVGNPHAVSFIKTPLTDEKFFKVGPKVEADTIFPQKTNVEFARIISDDLIEVRVWERGTGETLACGSGACAVAVLAIKNNLVKSKKITTRFKGGDLIIEWQDDYSIVMTGGYIKEFEGMI
jgi:diaminopimelate epimerase